MNFFKGNLIKCILIFSLILTLIPFGLGSAEAESFEAVEAIKVMPFADGEDLEVVPTLIQDEYNTVVKPQAANLVPIKLEATGDNFRVSVGNAGVDPLDSVTVKVTATGYSQQTATKTKVMPVIGADFDFKISMISPTMKYNVTVLITDGGKLSTVGKTTTWSLTESDLSSWHKGTFPTKIASVDHHYGKHGREVGASNLIEYVNLSIAMHKTTWGIKASNSTFTVVDTPASGNNVAQRKYTIKGTGRYILVTNTKQTQILSFGGKM